MLGQWDVKRSFEYGGWFILGSGQLEELFRKGLTTIFPSRFEMKMKIMKAKKNKAKALFANFMQQSHPELEQLCPDDFPEGFSVF